MANLRFVKTKKDITGFVHQGLWFPYKNGQKIPKFQNLNDGIGIYRKYFIFAHNCFFIFRLSKPGGRLLNFILFKGETCVLKPEVEPFLAIFFVKWLVHQTSNSNFALKGRCSQAENVASFCPMPRWRILLNQGFLCV